MGNMGEKDVEEDEKSENLPIIDSGPGVGIQRPRQREGQSQNDGQKALNETFSIGFAALDFANDDRIVGAAAFAGAATGAAFGIDDPHDTAGISVVDAQHSAMARLRTISAARAAVVIKYDFGIFHFHRVSTNVDDRHRKIF